MTLHTGDCLDVMAQMPAASIDAIVTDPPYAFPGGFMSKAWDRFEGEDLDAGFLHWFAGFVDGEGCFSVHRKPQDTFDCQFSITLRADDRPILERIHRTLGIGTLSKPTAHRTGDDNPKARFSVSSKPDCVRLRDIFRAFPLRAKKALDFEEWSTALDAWLTHETGEWQDMAESRGRLMGSRAYKPDGVRVDPYQLWTIRWARQALRVLKPGGWLIAAGAPKRVHRMTAGLEDAGFEIRDMILHCFASGFPKGRANLKPAYEPWVLARKPGPLRELAIDACRIGTEQRTNGGMSSLGVMHDDAWVPGTVANTVSGRWPANVILTDPIFDGGVDGVVGGSADHPAGIAYEPVGGKKAMIYGEMASLGRVAGYGDGGTYSRFFLLPKAARVEREPLVADAVFHGSPWSWERSASTASSDLAEPIRDVPNLSKPGARSTAPKPRSEVGTTDGGDRPRVSPARLNHHPTVKPLDLMRHLVRLVTPAGGGVVLDCFAGSGSTLIAAEMEGFAWIGIEREESYVAIAEARLQGVQRGLGLSA